MLVYLYVCKAFYCCVSSVFVVPEGKKKKASKSSQDVMKLFSILMVLTVNS